MPVQLSAHAALLAERCVEWLDPFWDERAGLIYFPSDYSITQVLTPQIPPPGVRHGVRETAQYVVALMIRDGPGDRSRSITALHRIVHYQFDEPGAVYHGTFYRFAEEPHPGKAPVIWKDYDANWRQFIGTTFAILLDEFSDRFDLDLIRDMERSIRLAVVGETDRLKPTYTNIALMKAALDVWAGTRFGIAEWIERGNTLADAVFELFQPHSTFYEYNSPTYYGVNLYALQCWKRSASTVMRERGCLMEAELWHDIGRFYHSGLKNLCGPFDRAYGLNMLDYANLIGLWIWLQTGETSAPFPHLGKPFAHRHDFCAAALNALLGTTIPREVVAHLESFQQERLVKRMIESNRIATAWLGESVMFGGESGNQTVNYQYRPATIHWRCSDDIATLHLENLSPVDARAIREGMSISGKAWPEQTSCRLIFNGPNDPPIRWEHGILTMPGLSLKFETVLKNINLAENSLCFQIDANQTWQIQIRL